MIRRVMMKKILMISPTPTHPTNAGNRSRIRKMAEMLTSSGHEVHFLFSKQEPGDEAAMTQYWGSRYHAVDYVPPSRPLAARLARRVFLMAFPRHKYYTPVDDHYNTLLNSVVKELHRQYGFDAVIAEYIFQSKALQLFDDAVLKIIDTHDVMTRRHLLFLRQGRKPGWYSTTLAQERKGIRRADVVIAIQERELRHFQQITRKPVICVGHPVNLDKHFNPDPRERMLFVGSDNPSNLFGIEDFIRDVFPACRLAFAGIELLVAGNICRRLSNLPDGVRLLGEVDDLSKVYLEADIVINPLNVGTGLKIKMIEAMGLSKAVISTPVGAEGLEEGADCSYLVYQDTTGFIGRLTRLLSDQQHYREICRKAYALASSWNLRNSRALSLLFTDTGVNKSID